MTRDRTVWQESSLHLAFDLSSENTVIWLTNSEVRVNKDGGSQFFVTGRTQIFCLFLHMPSRATSLGVSCRSLSPSPYTPGTACLLLSPALQSYPVPWTYYFAPAQSCPLQEQNMWCVFCFWCWPASQPKYVSVWVWAYSTGVTLH